MATQQVENEVRKLLGEETLQESPAKKQKTLRFKALSPVEKVEKVMIEHESYKAAKSKTEEAMQDIENNKKNVAEDWGLPWPKLDETSRKGGGPRPRGAKWREGLYKYLIRCHEIRMVGHRMGQIQCVENIISQPPTPLHPQQR